MNNSTHNRSKKVNNMRNILALLIFTSLACDVYGKDQGVLMAHFVMNVCMAQDKIYLQTQFAQDISENKEYIKSMREGAMDQMFKCMAKKSPMPHKLCNMLLSHTQESINSIKFETLFQDHGDSIQKINEFMQECMPPGAH